MAIVPPEGWTNSNFRGARRRRFLVAMQGVRFRAIRDGKPPMTKLLKKQFRKMNEAMARFEQIVASMSGKQIRALAVKADVTTVDLPITEFEDVWAEVIRETWGEHADVEIVMDSEAVIRPMMERITGETAILIGQAGLVANAVDLQRRTIHLAQLVTRINRTTRNRLRQAITSAVDRDLTVLEAISEVKDKFESIGDRRIETIVRTEMGRAHDEATKLSLINSGVVTHIEVIGCEAIEPGIPTYRGIPTCNIKNVPIEDVDELQFHINHTGSIVPSAFKGSGEREFPPPPSQGVGIGEAPNFNIDPVAAANGEIPIAPNADPFRPPNQITPQQAIAAAQAEAAAAQAAAAQAAREAQDAAVAAAASEQVKPGAPDPRQAPDFEMARFENEYDGTKLSESAINAVEYENYLESDLATEGLPFRYGRASITSNAVKWAADNFGPNVPPHRMVEAMFEDIDMSVIDDPRITIRLEGERLAFSLIGTGLNIDRRIDALGGKIIAYHEYFSIREGMEGISQGGGIGKALFRGSLRQYKKMGVDAISVHANIDVGGYAWARYGYAPTNKTFTWGQMLSRLEKLEASDFKPSPALSEVIEKMGKKKNQTADFFREVASIKEPIPYDLATGMIPAGVELPPGQPVSFGKAVLLGSDWEGEIDLKDPKRLAIVEQYVKAKK